MSENELSISNGDFWLIVLAIFVPPATVAIKKGVWTKSFWGNVALMFLFVHVPAIVHAIYIVLRYPETPGSRQGYTRIDEESSVGFGPDHHHDHDHDHDHRRHHHQDTRHPGPPHPPAPRPGTGKPDRPVPPATAASQSAVQSSAGPSQTQGPSANQPTDILSEPPSYDTLLDAPVNPHASFDNKVQRQT